MKLKCFLYDGMTLAWCVPSKVSQNDIMLALMPASTTSPPCPSPGPLPVPCFPHSLCAFPCCFALPSSQSTIHLILHFTISFPAFRIRSNIIYSKAFMDSCKQLTLPFLWSQNTFEFIAIELRRLYYKYLQICLFPRFDRSPSGGDYGKVPDLKQVASKAGLLPDCPQPSAGQVGLLFCFWKTAASLFS